MFVGAESSPSIDQWIRPRPKPGLRLWRLKRLGANVDRGAEAPRPLLTRLILRTLAAPFVAAWYVIGLGLVGFFMFIAIFIGFTVFGMGLRHHHRPDHLHPRAHQADCGTAQAGSRVTISD